MKTIIQSCPLEAIRAWFAEARAEIAAANEAGLSLRSMARRLRVDHSHLSRVLRGQRESRSLLARYQQLQNNHGGHAE